MNSINVKEYASFIWAVADTLRGDYKQADYGKIILPLAVLRRMDCVLKDKKEKVFKTYESLRYRSNSFEIIFYDKKRDLRKEISKYSKTNSK